jgi:dTDP-4-dehydrorhamnose 3,5-epimerase
MRFVETDLPGAFVVDLEPVEDERGMFARSWSRETFEGQGLDSRASECSVSYNRRAGTLRGLHYQADPHVEAKLVRCTSGAVFDVVVDLRPESPTFRGWFGAELTGRNRRALYVPAGCAHGFQTLADDSEVLYLISVPYVPASSRGVRWDDPAFGIEWPECAERVINERDRTYPDFDDRTLDG